MTGHLCARVPHDSRDSQFYAGEFQERGFPCGRLEQRNAQVGARDREGNAGETRAAADIDNARMLRKWGAKDRQRVEEVQLDHRLSFGERRQASATVPSLEECEVLEERVKLRVGQRQPERGGASTQLILQCRFIQID